MKTRPDHELLELFENRSRIARLDVGVERKRRYQPMKHHFVPQFYLKGFTDPATPAEQTPYLWTADINTQAIRRRAPGNAAALTDYYAIQDDAGVTAHDTETTLSAIESDASLVMAKVCDGRYDLTNDEREHLALMAAMQVTRVPAFRNRIEAFIGDIGDSLFRLMARDPQTFLRDVRASGAGEGKTDDEIEELRKAALTGDAFSFRGHPMASLRQAMTAALDIVGPMILRMSWAFVRAPEDAAFITSDNPSFWHNPNARGAFGRGLGARDTELTYPLSSGTMLLANWQGFNGGIAVDAAHVRRVNTLIAHYANQLVFAPSEDTARDALAVRPPPQTQPQSRRNEGQYEGS
jgi:hypothetical protein